MKLELALAKLISVKAQAKSAAADDHNKHVKYIDNIEQKIDAMRAKLKERSLANKDVWDLMRYCF